MESARERQNRKHYRLCLITTLIGISGFSIILIRTILESGVISHEVIVWRSMTALMLAILLICLWRDYYLWKENSFLWDNLMHWMKVAAKARAELRVRGVEIADEDEVEARRSSRVMNLSDEDLNRHGGKLTR